MLRNKLNFKVSNKLSAVLVLMIVVLVALACSGSKPEMPNDAAVQSLVKGTMSDFTDGVDKGDFSALRNNASQDFQSQFAEDKLKTTFKDFSDKKALIVPILRTTSGMTPKFSAPPSIREENGNYVLVANGTFDTTPAGTRFANEYVWRDNAWKLLKVGVFLQ